MKQSLLNLYAKLAVGMRISLAIGQLMCSAPSAVVEAVRTALLDHKHNRYVPVAGSERARRAVAKTFGQIGLAVCTEQCMLGNGAKSLYRLAIMAITKPGDVVIFFSPGYPPYWRVAKLLDRKAVQVELDGSFYPDLDKLDITMLAAKAEGRKCVLVVCNPCNPTGVAWGRETPEAISQVAKRHQVAVIADETYGDFLHNGVEFVPFARVHGVDGTITIRSASKELGIPGYRLGYAMGTEEVIAHMIALAGDLDGCPNTFANAVAVLLPNRQSFVRQQLKHLSENRGVVLEWLNKHRYQHAPLDGGFFAWLRLPLPESISSRQFADLLSKNEVGVIPGESFWPIDSAIGSPKRHGWIRVSYAGEAGQLKQGLKIISEMVSGVTQSNK